MSRYTPPSDDEPEISTSFRRRPLWMRAAIILCLVGVVMVALGNVIVIFL